MSFGLLVRFGESNKTEGVDNHSRIWSLPIRAGVIITAVGMGREKEQPRNGRDANDKARMLIYGHPRSGVNSLKNERRPLRYCHV